MNGIIKADQRIAAAKKAPIKVMLLGGIGVGKTTQARLLDPKRTQLIDLEAGTIAVGDWAGDIFPVRDFSAQVGAHPWEMCRALALYIGGADPADADGPYSAAMYEQAVELFGDPAEMVNTDTFFIDSITVASRWALAWAATQPEAFSEKTGKPDKRGAYGLMGQEIVTWLTHLQHAPKSVIIACILDRVEDDLKRVTWQPQIEGAQAAKKMGGIFDQIVTLDYLYDERGKAKVDEDGEKIRAFYTKTGNAHGFPAKDRSGVLDPIEPPDIAALIVKIRSQKRTDTVTKTLKTAAPEVA